MNRDISRITKHQRDDNVIPYFSPEEIVDALNSRERSKEEKNVLLDYLLTKSPIVFLVHILGKKVLPNINNRIVILSFSTFSEK